MKKLSVKAFVTIGMLSAISYVLMIFNFPLPALPNFLLVDFSDVPALIATIIIGPVAGILVELLKNMIDLLTTGSQTGVPVGHIANFVTGVTFILTVYFIYIKIKSKKGMTIALIAATVVTALVMSLLNYIVFLPMYSMFMGLDLPAEIVVTGILPFNLIKGAIIAIVFWFIFLKMQNWMHKQEAFFTKA